MKWSFQSKRESALTNQSCRINYDFELFNEDTVSIERESMHPLRIPRV